MKFAIDSEQRDYFRKMGFIPFADLLNKQELSLLNAGINEALKDGAEKRPGSNAYIGRDMWRKDDRIKNIVFSKRLIELAYAIVDKKPLRIAFDQYFAVETKPKAPLMLSFSETASIQQQSCISHLQGLFLICIQNDVPRATAEQKEDSPFDALVQGSGIFLNPANPYPFAALAKTDMRRFLLIAYGDNYSQYLAQPADPQGHFLKSLGYVFGDRLNDRLHPIVYR